MRSGVNTGGKMTRKRTLHNLRNIARRRQSEWWARIFDEIFFVYLSGARGINADYILPTTWTGRANNALSAPDASHLLYGGDATAKADLDATDKFTLTLVERAVTKATMMGGGISGSPQIQPCMIEGEERYVIVMNPYQLYDLRVASGTNTWMDVQKAAAAAEGRNNPMFKGAAGLWRNTLLHEHKGVIQFSDYGSGGNVAAARALFMGCQAAVCAYGSPGTNLRFDWHEETQDRGNEVVISTSSIFGVKKCTFNSLDFGVMGLDTAAADPG